jgi:hypothetical protein
VGARMGGATALTVPNAASGELYELVPKSTSRPPILSGLVEGRRFCCNGVALYWAPSPGFQLFCLSCGELPPEPPPERGSPRPSAWKFLVTASAGDVLQMGHGPDQRVGSSLAQGDRDLCRSAVFVFGEIAGEADIK